MDRFLVILREELELALRIGGSYASKIVMLSTFDRVSIKALARYASEKGIDLTWHENNFTNKLKICLKIQLL